MSEWKIAGESEKASEAMDGAGETGNSRVSVSAVCCARGAVTMEPSDPLCESRKYFRMPLRGVDAWLPLTDALVLYLLEVSIPPIRLSKPLEFNFCRGSPTSRPTSDVA